jgi:DNA repair protein RadC
MITRQLVEAGRIMDIPVHDHIIICGNSYVSFAENGWLEGQ